MVPFWALRAAPWPPARGDPPFGPVFGLNCKQKSPRKARPFGCWPARSQKTQVALGELWNSAPRRYFLQAKTRRFEVPMGKMSDFRASKNLIFPSGFCDTQTDGGQIPLGTPPLTQENRSPWRTACAAPHSNKFSVSCAEKMEYFITFPASALVWKALLGAPSERFWGRFPTLGALSGPSQGVPPPLLGQFLA